MTDHDFSIQVMKKYLRLEDKELLDDAYIFYSERLEKIPYPTIKGIKFILDDMAEKHPQRVLLIFHCFKNWSTAGFLSSSGKISHRQKRARVALS
jgi:hypothetical protein